MVSDAEHSDQIALYDAIGGGRGCRELARAFYARIPASPVLRSVYPESSHCAVDALGAYFVQLLGGPNAYSRQRYWLSLTEAHARFRIGATEREAWLATMRAVLNALLVEEPVREALYAFFERSSASIVNHPSPVTQEAASRRAAEGAPRSAFNVSGELETKWALQ